MTPLYFHIFQKVDNGKPKSRLKVILKRCCTEAAASEKALQVLHVWFTFCFVAAKAFFRSLTKYNLITT